MMIKRCIFLVLCCFCALLSNAQKLDSLKADSLKKGSAIKLNTVVIRGHRPVIERRVDGIVFNVENLPTIASGDAADVLRKVPMVSVDGNGGLAVKGSPNVKVFIDGKPSAVYGSSLSDVLRVLRSENISKIEVITEPSAKYDAEGTDAVINIITKKLKNNITNGSIGGTLANRGQNVVGDIHHQHNSIQIHGDGVYQGYRNTNGSVLTREAPGIVLQQENETQQRGTNLNAGVSFIYSLDSLNTFNVGYRFRKSISNTDGVANNYDVNSGSSVFLFRRNTETPGSAQGNIFNLGFNGRSKDKKSQYAILGAYIPTQNVADYALQQLNQSNTIYNERFFSTGANKDYIIQADYSKSFNGDSKFETGAKLTGKESGNTSLYQPDAGRSTTFKYTSRIYAAYANLTFRLGKWGFSGGLRYERTELGQTIKSIVAPVPSFNNLVPQALVQLALNDRSSLKLSYARKIVRPFVSYLDPTVNTIDSLTLQHGNPNLQPEVTNRYQFSYSVNTPKLFRDITLFFNDNRNSIENIKLPLSNGRFESTWQNVGKNQRLGLSASVNWKPNSALTLGSTLTMQYVWLESKALNISNNGLLKQIVINGNYKLPQGFSIDFYGFFDADNIRLQGYRNGWKFYNMTLNKKFKGDRLNLSLRSEAFLTKYSFMDEGIISQTYTERLSYRYQNQSLRLSVSYKIGKKEVKSLQVRSAEQ